MSTNNLSSFEICYVFEYVVWIAIFYRSAIALLIQHSHSALTDGMQNQ